MAFQNQFSLSLELTRLIPLGLSIAGKTYEAALSLARDLQSSGSDIVIEEDLASLFGRFRIAPNMASSFRTIVAKSEPAHRLCEGIALQDGPGPTVIRGLTQTPYFAMVIQCSLLISVFKKDPLAAALAQNFENQAEGAPEGYIPRATPSVEGIRGVLQACEDQTSSFDWCNLLLPVAGLLGFSETKISEAISPVVLRGLLSMLPLVQHFPEDRLIVIETGLGVCIPVVWAHHVLGLCVFMRMIDEGREVREVRFGVGPEQLTINVQANLNVNGVKEIVNEPSITLLSTPDKETLFKLEAEPDEGDIDATLKRPAKGFAKRVLDRDIPYQDGRETVIHEMVLITCAFAILISRHLSIAAPGEYENIRHDDWVGKDDYEESIDAGDTTDTNREALVYKISEKRVMEAACLLFDIRDLNKQLVEDYVTKYANRSLYYIKEPPRSISVILNEWTSIDSPWHYLTLDSTYLSILILAFAHVANLETCAGLPLCEHHLLLAESDFSMAIARWNGCSSIGIHEDVWFRIIILLMTGHKNRRKDLDLDTACLLSERGWSIYLSTFGDSDPSYTDSGYVTIKKGVPCRRGVWKHLVVDGPTSDLDQLQLNWSKHAIAGDEMSLCCTDHLEYFAPYCGERGDCFLVNLRMRIQGGKIYRRTGYNELSSALWITQKTKSCPHISRLGNKITLEPGCVAVSGFGDNGGVATPGLTICLTAHNSVTRWCALIAILLQRDHTNGYQQVTLRGRDCCLQCAVDQARRRPGKGYLVL